MRTFSLVLIVLTVLAAPVLAQNSNGYVFFAPGGVTCCGNTAMTLHLGVGGEGIIGKGIGAGLELGAVGTRQYFRDSVLGVLSPNGYYHFVHGKRLKADPFVTGGYSLFFRSGHSNLANFGGGLNYWFHPKLGARLEMRDHVNTDSPVVHFWGFRFGLTFRSTD